MISASPATAYATKQNILAPTTAALAATLQVRAVTRANEELNAGPPNPVNNVTLDSGDLIVTRDPNETIAQHLSE